MAFGYRNLHSNMVLLKLKETLEKAAPQLDLHSNMVLLKRVRRSKYENRYRNLHSNMVLLKLWHITN